MCLLHIIKKIPKNISMHFKLINNNKKCECLINIQANHNIITFSREKNAILMGNIFL